MRTAIGNSIKRLGTFVSGEPTSVGAGQTGQAGQAVDWDEQWQVRVQSRISSGPHALQLALHELDRFGVDLMALFVALKGLPAGWCIGQAITGLWSLPVMSALQHVSSLASYGVKATWVAGGVVEAIHQYGGLAAFGLALADALHKAEQEVRSRIGEGTTKAMEGATDFVLPRVLDVARQLSTGTALASATPLAGGGTSSLAIVTVGCAVTYLLTQSGRGALKGLRANQRSKDEGILPKALTLFRSKDSGEGEPQFPLVFGADPVPTQKDKLFFQHRTGTFEAYVSAMYNIIMGPKTAERLFLGNAQHPNATALQAAIVKLQGTDWSEVSTAAKAVDTWIDFYGFGSFVWCSMDVFMEYADSAQQIKKEFKRDACPISKNGTSGQLRSLNEVFVPAFISFLCASMHHALNEGLEGFAPPLTSAHKDAATVCMQQWKNAWIRHAKHAGDKSKDKRTADQIQTLLSAEDGKSGRRAALRQRTGLNPAFGENKGTTNLYPRGVGLLHVEAEDPRRRLVEAQGGDQKAGLQRVKHLSAETYADVPISTLFPTDIHEMLPEEHTGVARHSTEEILSKYPLKKLDLMLRCVETAVRNSPRGADDKSVMNLVVYDHDMQNNDRQKSTYVATTLDDIEKHLTYNRKMLEEAMGQGLTPPSLAVVAFIIHAWRQCKHFGVFNAPQATGGKCLNILPGDA